MSSQQKRKQDDSATKAVKKSKKSRRRDAQKNTDRPNYKEIIKENPLFEKYYKEQRLVLDAEWDQFMSILRQELPSTFRITGTTNSDAHCLRQCLQERFFTELHKIEVDGENIPLPQPIPWYPDNLAWHVSLSKKFIRKSPLVKQFHNFLVKENEQGNISRQEAVSMIPPLLLDVLPNHKVLDMCAAPGSKTAQLIEFLHTADTLDNPIPDGVVIANDADAKRCYMLVHQAKRLNSPCFMVTNHDASVFPQLYYHKDCGTRVALSYDRILCDVPCSGDGTMRKNPMIWKTWSSNLSTGLHKLQLRILTRGLELLAVNGRLVYSTCSFNPVENEAIVAAVLKQCKGAVHLVDVSGWLNGLKRIPGMNTWKVLGKGGEWVDWSDGTDSLLPRPLVETMFPPVVEEAQLMGLEKCVRILPHHQDTGGFFVAVLEKSDILPWQSKKVSQTNPPVKPTTDTQTDQPTPSDGTTTPDEGVAKQNSEEQVETKKGQIKEEQSYEQTQLQEQQTAEQTQQTQIQEDLTQMKEEQLQAQELQAHEQIQLQEQQTETGTQEEQLQMTLPTLQGHSSPTELPEGTDPEKTSSCIGLVVKPPAAYNLYHKRRQHGCFKEDPYVFLSPADPDWKLIMEYYGFQNDFPVGQLLTRTESGKKRNVYLTSPLVRELVVRNGSSVKFITFPSR
ncbi:RNA cytosine-C(5)-methyltransferase NSUN2-like isoform X2 [Dysidea avara]|uniref:RNA cytosine-C(5)-methyltransferase NSUN2-like isoform X2 n=1 Tax=Dysidea avara TaxID=196820 RepID=UPI003316BD1F